MSNFRPKLGVNIIESDSLISRIHFIALNTVYWRDMLDPTGNSEVQLCSK